MSFAYVIERLCNFRTTQLLIPALVERSILLIIVTRKRVVGSFCNIDKARITASIEIVFTACETATCPPAAIVTASMMSAVSTGISHTGAACST